MSTLTPEDFLTRLDALLGTLVFASSVSEREAGYEVEVASDHGPVTARFLIPRDETEARSTLSMIVTHIFLELDQRRSLHDADFDATIEVGTEDLVDEFDALHEELEEEVEEPPPELVALPSEPPPDAKTDSMPARQMHISAQIPAVFALDDDEEPPVLTGKTTWPDELLESTSQANAVSRTYLGAPGGFQVPTHALFSETLPESRQQRLRELDLQLKNPSVRLELREPYVLIEIELEGKVPYSRRCLADVFFGAELSWIARALEDASHGSNIAVSGTSVTKDPPMNK